MNKLIKEDAEILFALFFSGRFDLKVYDIY